MDSNHPILKDLINGTHSDCVWLNSKSETLSGFGTLSLSKSPFVSHNIFA